ncbi:DUF262 domain-containing protein [Methylobacillus gramineus]|uniref:DUF262 domain-containing protein n=1 Tax=Methylobacillus gramineus TaxID=755169 RepID=UPI001CFFEC12|nr:DUF262 domain-containing protein [Methylobacillus gramineus]MCB5184025.1 DUF262 domain-containing protein [Methylobacillus gramineus]
MTDVPHQKSPLLPDRLLYGVPHEYPIGHIFAISPQLPSLKSEKTLVNFVLPPWSQKSDWNKERQARFVENIFLGIPIGYYVLHALQWRTSGVKPMSGWLLDGMNRITAIRDFTENKFTIFNGVHHDDLDELTRERRFYNQRFPCFELQYTNDLQQLRSIHDHLNYGKLEQDSTKRIKKETELVKAKVQ